jgi:PD-(D/E)XK nuclease superfamily
MAVHPLRTLADVLEHEAAVAVDGRGDVDAEDDADVDAMADLWGELDHAGREAAAVGGWTPDDPLRLTKATVTGLLRCPRRAVSATPAENDLSDELLVGLAVDAAAKLATLIPHRSPTADDTLAFLAATGDMRVSDRLAVEEAFRGGGGGAGTVRSDIAARVAMLTGAWPAIEPAWWPRVEEPVRCRLAGGAVMVSGRLDLLLGGPPTTRRAVIVEVKGGRWHDGMRADGHLYALMVALRDGRPPSAVVTVVADGTTEVEPVRPAVLATAASRVTEALRVAAGLAAGEPTAACPGTHCAHCPVRPSCPSGSSWRADGSGGSQG